MLVSALGKKKDADIVKLFRERKSKKVKKDGEEGTAIPSIKDWQPTEDIDADLESLKQVLAVRPVVRSFNRENITYRVLPVADGQVPTTPHVCGSEPIVRKTIDPVLGDNPTPEDILNLKL